MDYGYSFTILQGIYEIFFAIGLFLLPFIIIKRLIKFYI